MLMWYVHGTLHGYIYKTEGHNNKIAYWTQIAQLNSIQFDSMPLIKWNVVHWAHKQRFACKNMYEIQNTRKQFAISRIEHSIVRSVGRSTNDCKVNASTSKLEIVWHAWFEYHHIPNGKNDSQVKWRIKLKRNEINWILCVLQSLQIPINNNNNKYRYGILNVFNV